MRYYVLALLMILLDQGTKWLIVSKMQYGESIKIIQDFIYITSHRNRGAAFGILQGKMWLFFIITAIVVVAVIFYLQKYGRKEPLLGTSLALILGGAIGNFIDRLFRGEVVDFIDVKLFSYDYPIFNIADSALVIGVILMIIYTIRDGREQKENF